MNYESTLIHILGLNEQKITDNCTVLLDNEGNRVGSIRGLDNEHKVDGSIIRKEKGERRCHWKSIEIKTDKLHFYAAKDDDNKKHRSFNYDFDVYYGVYKSKVSLVVGENPKIYIKSKHFGDMEFTLTKDSLSFAFTTTSDNINYREKFNLKLDSNMRICSYEVNFCNKDEELNLNENRYKTTACQYLPYINKVSISDWYKDKDIRLYEAHCSGSIIDFVINNEMAMSTLSTLKKTIEMLWSGRENIFDMMMENPNMSGELKELINNDKNIGSVKIK